MLYLLIKSFHLAAVLTWVGGMLALSVTLAALRPRSPALAPDEQPLLAALHRWDRRVTTPALGLVWLLGIALVVMGGWYSAPWLWAKFAIVSALSGLHGNQSATLLGWLEGQAAAPSRARWAAWFTVGAVSAVALLVVIKPWGAV